MSTVRQSKLSKKVLVIEDFPTGFLSDAVRNLEWAADINEWVDKNQEIGFYMSIESGKKLPVYSPIRGVIKHLHSNQISDHSSFLEIQVPLDEDLQLENVELFVLKDALTEFYSKLHKKTEPMHKKVFGVAIWALVIPIVVVWYFGLNTLGIILGIVSFLIMVVIVIITHYWVYFSNAYKDLLFYDIDYISTLKDKKAKYIEID